MEGAVFEESERERIGLRNLYRAFSSSRFQIAAPGIFIEKTKLVLTAPGIETPAVLEKILLHSTALSRSVCVETRLN